VFGIDEQWAADLIEVINISKYNQGYRYLLTVVDVFSKYAWVQPLKSKTGKTVTEAMSKILKGGRAPVNLQTDDGKEFYNKTFQALMKQKGIHHFSTRGDTKASVVEQFNRTLKERLYRYFTVKNTLTFVPVLQDLVRGYNRSYHRSIKRAPDQVTLANSEDVWETVREDKKKTETPIPERRRSCETEQEVPAVQERVFTRLDRRGLRDMSGASWEGPPRTRWKNGAVHRLKARFTRKSYKRCP